MKKKLTLVVALVLVLALSVAGTLAYLTYTTDAVKNTFTVGKVNITLTETDATNNAKSYKMVPGNVLDKDPTVTVLADSEKCYLFVEVVPSTNTVTVGTNSYGIGDFIDYQVKTGEGNWTALDGVTNVYYRIVEASTANQVFPVIGYQKTEDETTTFVDNKVLVKGTVTNEMMNALNSADQKNFTLSFKAYAVQFENMTGVADAWNQVKPTP